MIIGTTPTHIFTLPEDVTNIDELHIIYAQNDRIVLVKKLKDCELEGNTIILKLTQEETFRFTADLNINIQVRVRIDQTVISSKILMDECYKCLELEILR